MLGEILYYSFCTISILYACVGDTTIVSLQNDGSHQVEPYSFGEALVFLVLPVVFNYSLAWLLRFWLR